MLQMKSNRIGRTVAIEPSRQFKNQKIDNRLKLAQINKLESDSSSDNTFERDVATISDRVNTPSQHKN